jgi:hypothetical protein
LILRGIIIVFLAASLSAATQLSTEELRAKLQQSTGGDAAKLAVEIASRNVEQASAEFTAGNSDRAHALIAEAAQLVERAGAAAMESNKKVKDTEISVRKLERRLEDIHRTVSFEDQDEIEESTKIIARVRNQLLDRMFGLDEKTKGKNK